MSSFVVSARKYRPTRFEDVVGQEHITTTLKNALRNDHLAHAFLFCGPRGVGKTTCARILAKVLNCQNLPADYEPCNNCPSCNAFNENASFNIIELDAASNNSVENIRTLIEQVRFQPQQGKYKIFIIDEVHMLSQAAFNAFLKTLEEPPAYAIFILATTEKHKILPTILSRCQIFDFKRIQIPEMAAHLEGICAREHITAEPEALHVIAQKADGALRDALSIFDRMVAASGNSVSYQQVIANLNVLDYDYYFRLVDMLLMEDLSQSMLLFNEILNKGFEEDLFINGLAEHLRNLLVCKDPETLSLLEVGAGLRERYLTQASLSPHAFLLSALNLANDCDINFRLARNKRLHVELHLLKIAYLQRTLLNPLSQHGEEKKKSEPNPIDTTAPSNTTSASLPVQESSGEPPKLSNPEPQPPITAPDNPAVADNTPPATPAPVAAPASWKSSGHLVATPRLDQLQADPELLRSASDTPTKEIIPLSTDHLAQAWEAYIESIPQETTRNLLKGISLVLNEYTIVAAVSSALIENTLRDERGLMEHLRTHFSQPQLALQIDVQKQAPADIPKAPKSLSNSDKLLKMYEKAPLVKDLAERFSLRFDEN